MERAVLACIDDPLGGLLSSSLAWTLTAGKCLQTISSQSPLETVRLIDVEVEPPIHPLVVGLLRVGRCQLDPRLLLLESSPLLKHGIDLLGRRARL
jgi:hypothetical protein